MSRTKIIRDKRKSNYSMINNEVLRRTDLSWKAKGILVYIFSLPDDWELYLEEIQEHATDGRDSFRTGWNELKQLGYVERFEVREKGKIVSWDTIIKETVLLSPHTEKPQVEKPLMEKPQVENPTLLNTNSTKDLLVLNTNSSKDICRVEFYQEIIEYLNEVCSTKFRSNNKTTQKHIKARVEEGFTLDDFKTVIDKKFSEWGNDEKMSQFLRPQTLFGTKFESYLNQKEVINSKPVEIQAPEFMTRKVEKRIMTEEEELKKQELLEKLKGMV